MDTRPVLFYDSGIGCLPYAQFFHSRNPYERIICVADRENFPYGQKTKEYLIAALSSLTEKLIGLYNPKVLAIACNSATVSALAELREQFPYLPIVGTVPAVKPAVAASKKRCVGVLGTRRTITDPCIAELGKQYGPDCAIAGIAAPELAEFVEYRWLEADREERLETIKPYIKEFLCRGADTLVLACTHFLLLKEEFRIAGGRDLLIFDSIEGISRRVEFFLNANGGGLLSNAKEKQDISLKITGGGALDPVWEKLGAYFGVVPEKI